MLHKRRLGQRYWQMWTAVASSSLGDGVFSVALPLLALRYTHSPLAISGIVIAGQVPVVLAALPVGTLADRLNRRRLIVAIELARFAVLATFASLVLLHRANLGLIYVAAFLLGGLNIAFDVVANACLPSLVRPKDLVRANAHILNAEMTAENLVGQALGGVAIAVSRSLPFVVDALGLAGAAALLRGAIPDNEPVRGDRSAWQDLREGLHWFAGHRLLRLLTTVIASLAFCQGLVIGLLALYGRQNLHLGSAAYGLLLAVASIGTVMGGLSASRIHDRLGSGHTLLLAGIGFGAAYPVLALTHSAAVAAGALMAQEAFVIIGNTASRSLRQRIVPAEMQGRAASANTVVILSCVPVGALLGGVVAGAMGVSAAFFAAGAVQAVLLAVTGPRLLRRIRAASATRTIRRVIDITTAALPEPAPAPAFETSQTA